MTRTQQGNKAQRGLELTLYTIYGYIILFTFQQVVNSLIQFFPTNFGRKENKCKKGSSDFIDSRLVAGIAYDVYLTIIMQVC